MVFYAGKMSMNSISHIICCRGSTCEQFELDWPALSCLCRELQPVRIGPQNADFSTFLSAFEQAFFAGKMSMNSNSHKLLISCRGFTCKQFELDWPALSPLCRELQPVRIGVNSGPTRHRFCPLRDQNSLIGAPIWVQFSVLNSSRRYLSIGI